MAVGRSVVLSLDAPAGAARGAMVEAALRGDARSCGRAWSRRPGRRRRMLCRAFAPGRVGTSGRILP